MDYYVARWYDPMTGHFTQADSLIPNGIKNSSFNRYGYVLYNPMLYIDRDGHDVYCAGTDITNCQGKNRIIDRYLGYRTEETYPSEKEKDESRKDNLITRVLLGGGMGGSWLSSDWDYYYKYRKEIWEDPSSWIHPDSPGIKGWQARLQRFASYYPETSEEQFVRDFALVWGGIPENRNWIIAALSVVRGPHELNFLGEDNSGFKEIYMNVDYGKITPDNQSHHYAGLFFLSYFLGELPSTIIGWGREYVESNTGDMNLGNKASNDAFRLRFIDDPECIVDYIQALSN